MAQELTDVQKIDVFRKMAAYWEAKDWRACADLMAPDGTLHSMMNKPLVGRETLYRRFVEIARPNKQVTLHIHGIGVIDGRVFVERTDEIIIDGESRSAPMVGILDFKGEHISRWREYFDLQQLLHAARREEELGRA